MELRCGEYRIQCVAQQIVGQSQHDDCFLPKQNCYQPQQTATHNLCVHSPERQRTTCHLTVEWHCANNPNYESESVPFQRPTRRRDYRFRIIFSSLIISIKCVFTWVGTNCWPLKRCEYEMTGVASGIGGISPWKTTWSQSIEIAVVVGWALDDPYCSVLHLEQEIIIY